jgi:signal transduction histidine kinase
MGDEPRTDLVRLSEARLRRILEGAGDGLLVFSPEGRLEYMNAAALSLAPLTAPLGLGTRFEALPEDLRTILPLLRVLRTDEPAVADHDLRPAGGVVRVRATPLVLRERLDAVVFYLTDVTAAWETAAAQAEARARREHARQLLDAQETERQTLAQELHDGMGQQLTSLILRLERSANADPDAIGAAKTLLAEVRGRSSELRPALLDDGGLLPALLELIGNLRATAGFEASLEHRGVSRRFDPRIETAIFRIAQEALGNALRHSQAGAARVSLFAKEEEIQLYVSDNGIGCSLTGSGDFGRGVAGMRQRAELLGGILLFASIPGKGTQVEASLPLLRDHL